MNLQVENTPYSYYCDACGAPILFLRETNDLPPQCPLCGHPLPVSIHQKSDLPLPKQIGSYSILRSLGRGGMGEVFLAYDPVCKREVALKRIRTDLTSHERIKKRFLREALITSQLAHPAIVPIHSIHEEEKSLYYIMPFLEGSTLKQLIQTALRKDDVEKGSLLHGEGSVASFLRIFVSICQAIAYAHSKGFLHRDLKPENVIVGKYGQVLILDWGLVQPIHASPAQEESEEIASLSQEPINPLMTRPGKIVGTIAYMAPERANGGRSTVRTDIYSLGVILYQLLTLRLPFKRGSLKLFKKMAFREELVDPALAAPYRDVPPELSRISVKALAANPEERYSKVDDLIQDLENYLEGRFSWSHMADLAIDKKKDWEFQENLFIAEHNAITRGAETTDWVTLMVSKMSFSGNTQIKAKIKINGTGQGLGLLLCVPEPSERTHPTDGYCLWINAERGMSTRLFRSTAQVMDIPEIILRRGKWHSIRLEKQDHNIHFFINDIPQFTYRSHLPLAGTHIGILYRDTSFEISDLSVSVGSHNLMVSCLAVPDAFLANKNFSKALSEYRRVGHSFPGRAEGREALFRAGITLLEQGKTETDKEKAGQLFLQAIDEFENLHGTSGAPLEYLGKALAYEILNDNEEEVKCLELACRRYSKIPLIKILEEHILYRMHESSQHNRIAAYRFILLVARQLPKAFLNTDHQKIFRRLQHHWEPLPFLIEDTQKEFFDIAKLHSFSTQLAFWLAKPYTLIEILDSLMKMEEDVHILINNALFSLIELGAVSLAAKKLEDIQQHKKEIFKIECASAMEEIEIALKCHNHPFNEVIEQFLSFQKKQQAPQNNRLLFYLVEYALRVDLPQMAEHIFQSVSPDSLTSEDSVRLNSYRIWTLLYQKQLEQAGEILLSYPLKMMNQESTLLHFLYGCWLYMAEGKEISDIHFSGILDTVFPRTWTLAAHYIAAQGHDNKKWIDQAFCWEKRQLYRQLSLYYRCANDPSLEKRFKTLESLQYVNV